MQRNFDPMRKQVETWQKSELTDVTAKSPSMKRSSRANWRRPSSWREQCTVNEPKYEEFRPRTIWSLSNAFTSAFKGLDPIPEFKATAKLGEFLETRLSELF
jgi:hypothetical protein